jgi:hypothetical protein
MLEHSVINIAFAEGLGVASLSDLPAWLPCPPQPPFWPLGPPRLQIPGNFIHRAQGRAEGLFRLFRSHHLFLSSFLSTFTRFHCACSLSPPRAVMWPCVTLPWFTGWLSCRLSTDSIKAALVLTPSCCPACAEGDALPATGHAEDGRGPTRPPGCKNVRSEKKECAHGH